MSTQNRLFAAMTPSFCSPSDTKQSLQYTINTHLSDPPMPEFEANMNCIPQSPPSSMKQCNKSATTTRKQSCSCATPLTFRAIFKPEERPFLPGSTGETG